MNSTVEPDEGNKVRVVVSFAEDDTEFQAAVDQAWAEISKQVRIPGFRPGKSPRRLLEQQLGADAARPDALQAVLPEFYAQAVIEHDVDVIAPPTIDITEGREQGDVTFEAIVETRPVITVDGYEGIRVEVPSPEVADEEVSNELDRLRRQGAELVEVDRASGDGDYVVVDVHGSRDGEPLEGLVADDYTYLVGSGAITPEFDEQLTGVKAGEVVEFEADHPNPEEAPVNFRVLVKTIKEQALPEATDEWAANTTEFDTAAEVIEDIRSRIATEREAQTRGSVQARLGSAIAELVSEEPPDAMVSEEMQGRLQSMAHQLSHMGMRLEDYIRITGQDPESFTAGLREAAIEACKVDLALRAVVLAEGIAVSDEDLDEQILQMIGDADIELDDAKANLQSNGQLSAVRSELAKTKAVAWLLERAEVVDTDGNPVPAALLTPLEDDHDHDHDH
ncbi:MAG: trigger factor, partial [Actinomycetes bacterium]